VDINGTNLPDLLNGTPQHDNIWGRGGNDTIYGQGGNDKLYGGPGNDTIFGQGGDDNLYGGDGNDVLVGGAGFDYFDGGSGHDTVSYAYATQGLTIDLAHDYAVGTGFPETLKSIEGAIGGSGNDDIFGDGGANNLVGRAGNDWLYGRGGNDVLRGDAGHDHFVFDTSLNAATNVDKILDFTPADDEFRLTASVFHALPFGTLPAGQFLEGNFPSGQDHNDHIIYNNVTGAVYYDRDGSGAAASVEFAVISPGLAVTNHDFFVV
jgi:serralysin